MERNFEKKIKTRKSSKNFIKKFFRNNSQPKLFDNLEKQRTHNLTNRQPLFHKKLLNKKLEPISSIYPSYSKKLNILRKKKLNCKTFK